MKYREIDLFTNPRLWVLNKQLEALRRYQAELHNSFDEYIRQVPEEEYISRRILDRLAEEEVFIIDSMRDHER